MEIFQEKGKTGRKYYVYSIFDEMGINDLADKRDEVARLKKVNPLKLKTIWVYVKGGDLYLEPVKGSVKMVAVTMGRRLNVNYKL